MNPKFTNKQVTGFNTNQYKPKVLAQNRATWVDAAGRWIDHLWLLLLLLLWILLATRRPQLIIDACNSSSAQSLVASLLPVSLAETHQRYCTKNQADGKHHCCDDYLE